MRPDELPLAILTFVAFVAVTPVWVDRLASFTPRQPETAFLGAMVLPAVAFLFLSSWVKPELSGVILGGFLLAGMMVLAPWWMRFAEMMSGQLGGNTFTRLVLQLSLPLLFLTFLVSLGKRRVSQQ